MNLEAICKWLRVIEAAIPEAEGVSIKFCCDGSGHVELGNDETLVNWDTLYMLEVIMAHADLRRLYETRMR